MSTGTCPAACMTPGERANHALGVGDVQSEDLGDCHTLGQSAWNTPCQTAYHGPCRRAYQALEEVGEGGFESTK